MQKPLTRERIQEIAKGVNLYDLIPQAATFDLKSTNKTYHLRPIDLKDEAWLATEFGARLQVILTELRIVEIVRIAFHQLELDDARTFKKTQVTIVNDEGDEIQESLGGYRLLMAQVQTLQEKEAIIRAVLETFGFSRPMQDEVEKKSLEEPDPSIGEKSLTSSPPSTVGPPTISPE